MAKPIAGRAVVNGAGISGLSAAAALSESFSALKRCVSGTCIDAANQG
jgi:glycine/D-amino acid oxidase-like deaminating enzyme